jgi:hypothetical protein
MNGHQNTRLLPQMKWRTQQDYRCLRKSKQRLWWEMSGNWLVFPDKGPALRLGVNESLIALCSRASLQHGQSAIVAHTSRYLLRTPKHAGIRGDRRPELQLAELRYPNTWSKISQARPVVLSPPTNEHAKSWRPEGERCSVLLSTLPTHPRCTSLFDWDYQSDQSTIQQCLWQKKCLCSELMSCCCHSWEPTG